MVKVDSKHLVKVRLRGWGIHYINDGTHKYSSKYVCVCLQHKFDRIYNCVSSHMHPSFTSVHTIVLGTLWLRYASQ